MIAERPRPLWRQALTGRGGSRGVRGWRWAVRGSPSSVSPAGVRPPSVVVGSSRRDIRQREGLRVDEEDLAAAIHEMFSAEARELIGPMRIRRRRKAAKKSAGPVTVEEVLKGNVEPA